MRADVEKLENSKVKLEIEVGAEEFEKAMQKSYLKNRRHIVIQGFRKGKAPRKVIENFYGEEIFYEDALNEAFPVAYDKAIEEKGLFPIEQPSIDIVQVGGGDNLIFTAEVTVKPDVKLGQYKGIEIEKVEYNVTDQDVDERLNTQREQNARWIAVEDRPVQEGDRLTIDYSGSVDGQVFDGGTAENQTLEIGSNTFIPGFEEQLVGKELGFEGDIEVTFPEEYHAEDLKGKNAVFAVKVHEIKEKELPELDDEFVKDISDKFETLEEYRADLEESMIKAAKDQAESTMRGQLVQSIADNATIEIPDLMVENQIDSIIKDMEMRFMYQGMNMDMYLEMTGMTMEDLRKDFRDNAYNTVKTQLAMEEVTKVEALEVVEDDIEAEYAKIANQYNMDIEKVKESYKEQEAMLRNNIAIEKTIDYLMEEAKMIEPKENKDGPENEETGDTKETINSETPEEKQKTKEA